MNVRSARLPEDLEPVRALLREYFDQLMVATCFGDFDAELAALPGDYRPPGGDLLVAVDPTERVVGCVALRDLGDGIGEMKRLYLASEARGTGAGRRLVEEIVALARRAGYRAIRLDTLPTQRAAQRIYADLGFVEVAPYRYNPVEGTRYLELRLTVDL
jgi:ribosomal protein S18 acetylase RimI-like enzyme